MRPYGTNWPMDIDVSDGALPRADRRVCAGSQCDSRRARSSPAQKYKAAPRKVLFLPSDGIHQDETAPSGTVRHPTRQHRYYCVVPKTYSDQVDFVNKPRRDRAVTRN